MQHKDLREGMKIKAMGDWCDCWKSGDEFTVKADSEGAQPPRLYIDCHDPENGPKHGLDDGDGELPEFEPVA
jgi:hypothetical protein